MKHFPKYLKNQIRKILSKLWILAIIIFTIGIANNFNIDRFSGVNVRDVIY